MAGKEIGQQTELVMMVVRKKAGDWCRNVGSLCLDDLKMASH